MMKTLMQCLLLTAILVGCSQQDAGRSTWHVPGKVTLDGSPLESGTISLIPQDGIGGAYGSDIVDGTFDIETTAGTKLVQISSYRKSETLVGPDGKPGTEQFLPVKYNQKSELTAEIPEGGDIELQFELKSK